MNVRYEIFKVKYEDKDNDEIKTFKLSEDVNFDVFAIYEYKGEPELGYWVSDFTTLGEAEAFIISKLG